MDVQQAKMLLQGLEQSQLLFSFLLFQLLLTVREKAPIFLMKYYFIDFQNAQFIFEFNLFQLSSCLVCFSARHENDNKVI